MLMLALLLGYSGFRLEEHRARPPCLVFVMNSQRVFGGCYSIVTQTYPLVVIYKMLRIGSQRQDLGGLGLQDQSTPSSTQSTRLAKMYPAFPKSVRKVCLL